MAPVYLANYIPCPSSLHACDLAFHSSNASIYTLTWPWTLLCIPPDVPFSQPVQQPQMLAVYPSLMGQFPSSVTLPVPLLILCLPSLTLCCLRTSYPPHPPVILNITFPAGLHWPRGQIDAPSSVFLLHTMCANIIPRCVAMQSFVYISEAFTTS